MSSWIAAFRAISKNWLARAVGLFFVGYAVYNGAAFMIDMVEFWGWLSEKWHDIVAASASPYFPWGVAAVLVAMLGCGLRQVVQAERDNAKGIAAEQEQTRRHASAENTRLAEILAPLEKRQDDYEEVIRIYGFLDSAMSLRARFNREMWDLGQRMKNAVYDIDSPISSPLNRMIFSDALRDNAPRVGVADASKTMDDISILPETFKTVDFIPREQFKDAVQYEAYEKVYKDYGAACTKLNMYIFHLRAALRKYAGHRDFEVFK